MRERGWGRIINIASVHGVVGSAGKSAYVAAKHGVIGLTKVGGAGNGGQQHHRQRHLPRLGADAAGPAADRRWPRARALSAETPSAACWAKHNSGQFVTPQQIGELAFLFTRRTICGRRALKIDGGWTAGKTTFDHQ